MDGGKEAWKEVWKVGRKRRSKYGRWEGSVEGRVKVGRKRGGSMDGGKEAWKEVLKVGRKRGRRF